MAIRKHSLVKLIGEEKIGYVEEVVDGLLRISTYGILFENKPEIVREIIFNDLSTEELFEISEQLQVVISIYKNEIKRRAYDVQKNKSRSKYILDDFQIRRPKK